MTLKVTDYPPPIGTMAVIFWGSNHYGASFRGVSKRTGMWHFAGGGENFLLTPGSRMILQYLAGQELKCVAKTIENDSQLGP